MWPYPRIIAHRGGGTLAPENTIAGVRCGLSHGFHAVEFDVMLAGDNVPVVMHDPQLGRTVSGQGKISDFTAAQLSAMDAGRWLGPAFAGETVPTYEQVYRFCSDNTIWMNVEIKPVPGFEKITGQVVAEVTRRLLKDDSSLTGTGSRILFSSFSFDALAAAAAVAPEIPRGFLMDVIRPDWQSRLEQLQAVALHVNHKYLSDRQAQAVKDAGYGLFCYTVNDPSRAREILAWGVDAFCTDRVDLIGPDFA